VVDLRIISYNLRKHAAIGELTELAVSNDVDVMCLQECDTDDLADSVAHLRLIDATSTNRLGLALYARADRYTVQDTKMFSMHRSLHDRVLSPAHERLLAARLHDEAVGHDVLVGSFHAAPLTASNRLRRKQITAAHEGMRSLGHDVPAVMVGDFNYPWFVNGLERHVNATGYDLLRSTEPTYFRYRFFSGYFDFVTSTGVQIDRVDVLPAGASDHRPIRLAAHAHQHAT